MASSGSLTTPSTEGRSLTFSWTEKSQSVSNNSTTISWTLKGSGSASGYVKCGGFYVNINGSVLVDKSTDYRVKVYSGTEVASGTTTIKHNSDGSKSFDVVINAGIYTYARNSKKEGTFTLDKIARASTITSASNVTLGNNCSVKWTPLSSAFYYKLKFILGDWSKTVSVGCPNTTSAYTYTGYTIPESVANYITTSTTGTMKVYLYTYSSSSYSTQIGSADSDSFTVTVPSDILPSIESLSVSLVNDNDVINEWNIYVKGYSKAKISCVGEGNLGSTISGYVLTGGYNTTVSSMPYTGSVLQSSGTINFTCKVKDSRGRISSDGLTKSVTVYDYYEPSIDKFTTLRNEKDASKIIVDLAYTYASVNEKNTASAILYYRKSVNDKWDEYGEIPNNTQTELNIDFEDTSSYIFQVIVTDLLSKNDKEESIVSTMKVIMDFRDGGKGLGLGKIAESDALEVGFESKFFENATFDKDIDISGNLKATNLGRTVYSGKELITDYGMISTDGSHYIYFYLLKPFNLVYVRMRIDGMESAVDAVAEYKTLFTFDTRFQPSGATALAVSGGKGCDILINASSQVRIVPRNGLLKSTNIYASGIYSLSSNSELYQSY